MCKPLQVTESQLELMNEPNCGDLRDKLVQPFPRVNNWAWLLKKESPTCTACLSYVFYNGLPYCVKDIQHNDTERREEAHRHLLAKQVEHNLAITDYKEK